MENAKEPIAQRDILARLSRHADKLADQISDIEEHIGSTIDTGAIVPTALSKLQTIDYVRQSLEDCALLLHDLSTNGNGHSLTVQQVQKLCEKLKLHTTQEIVAPDQNGKRTASLSQTGNFDLF